jgi:hypothetical protein
MSDNLPGKRPTHEFGKRRPTPQPEPPSSPPKRSRHVALLVMGTLAVGSGAYALMGPENCQPAAPPGVANPAQPQAAATCTSRGSSFTGSHGNYSRTMHLGFFGGDSSSHGSSSATAESGSVTRGGFGSLAHAFGFSGRG